MSACLPWQSFSAGAGNLHFCSPLLKAVTRAWWWKNAAHVRRGQIWTASGNFTWWGARWGACCTSGECSPGQPLCAALSPLSRCWAGAGSISRTCAWVQPAARGCSPVRRWPCGPGAARGGIAAPARPPASALSCSVLPAEDPARQSSLKFAGAAFRACFKAKLANKKPLVDKRALRVNNWLSSLNP